MKYKFTHITLAKWSKKSGKLLNLQRNDENLNGTILLSIKWFVVEAF